MRIACFARTNYWQGIKGGMDVHARILAEGLAAYGHEVIVISTARQGIDRVFQRNGVEYHHVPGTVFGSRRKGWPEKSRDYFLSLHRDQPFDIIWSHSFDAYGMAKAIAGGYNILPPVMLCLAGSIVQECRSYFVNIKGLARNPIGLLKGAGGLLYSYFITQRPMLALADAVVAVSRAVKTDIGRWFGHRFEKKIIVIENGIDTKLFCPDPESGAMVRKSLGIPEDSFVILSLGRLTHEKGHHLAIEALAALVSMQRPVFLVIAGEGPCLSELRMLAEKKGVSRHVIFAGYVENEKTPGLYNAADLFVMPTMTTEGLPLVLLEAMACGLPVAATPSGGNRELVVHGRTGWQVSFGSAKDLVACAVQLMDDPASGRKIGLAARNEVCRKYSMERMVHKYETVMRSLSDKRA